MRKLRTALLVTASTVTSVAALTLGAGPAQATSGYEYDGTNPVTTGCSSSAAVVKDYPINRTSDGARVGTARVMYSNACGTNWVAVDNWEPSATAWKIIDRASPYFQHGEPDTVTGWSYGMQAYAPGATCISIQGYLTTPDNSNYADSGTQFIC
ncbi:DUF2690 domain-containing protein [Rathayibacter sp. Leaf299]|uniref:DUF2690 domain-containing protein n=1 Tax=Rathayibacter sp. Leaf299 TaxID=1736328 RepID=UPI0009EBAE0C|nr:DUF2690 domain-containing protein [Rathayibacter sp. Leaf299]